MSDQHEQRIPHPVEKLGDTRPRLGEPWPSRWHDEEAWEAMNYAEDMREMREWGWCRERY